MQKQNVTSLTRSEEPYYLSRPYLRYYSLSGGTKFINEFKVGWFYHFAMAHMDNIEGAPFYLYPHNPLMASTNCSRIYGTNIWVYNFMKNQLA